MVKLFKKAIYHPNVSMVIKRLVLVIGLISILILTFISHKVIDAVWGTAPFIFISTVLSLEVSKYKSRTITARLMFVLSLILFAETFVDIFVLNPYDESKIHVIISSVVRLIINILVVCVSNFIYFI